MVNEDLVEIRISPLILSPLILSSLALAVGKDVFGPNAQEFCTALKVAQDQIQDADDPQSSYLLSAWARVCKVLGEDFAPYLDYVMDSLLKSASLNPDFAIIDRE